MDNFVIAAEVLVLILPLPVLVALHAARRRSQPQLWFGVVLATQWFGVCAWAVYLFVRRRATRKLKCQPTSIPGISGAGGC